MDNEENIEDEELIYPGFLKLVDYTDKYGLKMDTVRHWAKCGHINAEKKPWRHHTMGLMACWFIEDKPPEEHEHYKAFKTKYRNTPYTHNSTGSRKLILKRLLQVFLEGSNPKISKYSRPDICSILDVTSYQVKTWELWGLPKTKFTGNKKIWHRDWYFSRQDLIDFLSGNWDEIRKRIREGHDTTPTHLISPQSSDQQHSATYDQAEDTGEGFYAYQEDKVFAIGYEGFMAWVREMKVLREDKRLRKFVPIEFIDIQKEFFFNALALKENGDFKHQDVGACRPRGDFKSFDIRLIFLFRFFNMFRESILIAANSKDQSTFVQYDEAVKVIQHTERLNNTPGLEIKKKSIELMEGPGKTFSKIIPIASKTGLLPGATCTVFTEICDLDDESFYSQLTGSLRGVPNAMNLIDSTVAPPGHVFDRLLKAYEAGKAPLVYIQYYSDKHYNPEISKAYLKHQENTLLGSEFNKYFRNRKEDAAGGVFPRYSVLEMGYSGIDTRRIGPSQGLRQAVQDIVTLESKAKQESISKDERVACELQVRSIKSSLSNIGDCYRVPISLDGIAKLSKYFGYDFIFGIGIDRANTMSVSNDRTAMVLSARVILTEEISLYFLLDLYVSKREATLSILTEKITEWTALVGWIDNVMIEAFQGQDLYSWCEDKGYCAQLVHPNYNVQHEMFSVFCRLMKMGQYKAPLIPYYTDRDGNLYPGFDPDRPDILREEMGAFLHNEHKRTFGTPEKRKKGGVKDDTVYAAALSIMATQAEGSGLGGLGMTGFPDAIINEDTIGSYS